MHNTEHDALNMKYIHFFSVNAGNQELSDIPQCFFLPVRSVLLGPCSYEKTPGAVIEDASRAYGSQRNWVLELSNNI